MYLDADGKPVENASLVGPLAAGVPGSPAGLHELHRRYGKLPWARVVAPAQRLAAEGFRVSRYLHDLLDKEESRRLLSRFPESVRIWLPNGEPPAAGSVLRLPDLAATLDRYAAQGPEGIAAGPAAAAVERASQAYGGVLAAADLAAYRPVWRTPLTFEGFGWQLAAMPLPSSGGVILGQTLGMLEKLAWGKLPRFGADRSHLLAEALRRSFADRFLLGDPATTKATEAQLLAPDWIARRAEQIEPRHATPSARVEPWPGAARMDAPAAGGETTHLSVVDGEGNLVALTTTLNGLFGCGLWVPGAGFFLNNEMDDFATAPGRPNLFGLLQGEANAVAPGKRMLSSMSPVIAWKGKEAYALGGRGGSRIPTNTIQVVLNLLVDGDPLQAAIDRPRLHHQWLPDRLEVETDSLSPETRSELEARGHAIQIAPAAAKVHAVHLLADGRVEAASDPRGSGVGGVVEPEALAPCSFFPTQPVQPAGRLSAADPRDRFGTADSDPRVVLAATRDAKRLEQTLIDLSAAARVERDRLEGRTAEVGEPPIPRVRRQLDKLLAFLTSRRPPGPHAVFLVADGPDLLPEQAAALERKGPAGSTAAPAFPFQRAARLLAAYGWVTIPVPLRKERLGMATAPQSEVEIFRQSSAPSDQQNGVPPIRAGRPPQKTALAFGGVIDLFVEPRTAALRILSQATAGTVIGFEEQIGSALGALTRRWRLWMAEPDGPVDGRLHSLAVTLAARERVNIVLVVAEVSVPGKTTRTKQVRAPEWIRSSTPEEIAEVRLAELLAHRPAGGDLRPTAIVQRTPAGPKLSIEMPPLEIPSLRAAGSRPDLPGLVRGRRQRDPP